MKINELNEVQIIFYLKTNELDNEYQDIINIKENDKNDLFNAKNVRRISNFVYLELIFYFIINDNKSDLNNLI